MRSWLALAALTLAGTAHAEDLVLDGTTMALSGEQEYDNVQIINGATLLVSQHDGLEGGRLVLRAQSIHVDATSSITASAAGFKANEDANGEGDGGGLGGDCCGDGGGGGGHGGEGGTGTHNDCETASADGGLPYADPATLVATMGSAGGAGGSLDGSLGGDGGAGGGAIELWADTITIEGSVVADGGNGATFASDAGGGGAGGGILVAANELLCTGTLMARGGLGGTSINDEGGAGGGGSIAQIWDESLLSLCTTDVTGGVSTCGASDGMNGVDFAGEGDFDGDGYTSVEGDCDPTDPTVHPNAADGCDLIDNDCDGELDEDRTATVVRFLDSDGDGHGDPSSYITFDTCDIPDEYVLIGDDCDDDDGAVSPGAVETCNGIDDDCNYVVDDGAACGCTMTSREESTYLSCSPATNWHAARATCDSMGYNLVSIGSAQENGFVGGLISGWTRLWIGLNDLDDQGVYAWDGGADVTATVWGAGEPSERPGEDCVELDVIDGTWLDSDCGISRPFICESECTMHTWYADSDGDGYGNSSAAVSSCVPPAGTTAIPGDCDDTTATVSPGAQELCDGVDNDCDSAIDEENAADAPVWFADADGDGSGDPEASVQTCTAPGGYVADSLDCDDTNAAIGPHALETCDSLDNDCDLAIDEADAFDALTWFADSDTDGFGDPANSTPGCTQPDGYTADASDCDDTNVAIYPGSTELCDLADNDCDGVIDEDDAADAPLWYLDADGDGFGDPAMGVPSCGGFEGYSDQPTDCDDDNADVYPGATELNDGLDNDCDGRTEDHDGDGDGLTDGQEQDLGTDPDDVDSDDDGLEDGDELDHGTDPLLPDSDTDQLIDGDEVHVWGTDPLNPDTDGEGLIDGLEVWQAGTDPWDPDTDNDAINDEREFNGTTDPLLIDTDGGGAYDGVESLLHATDPRNPLDDSPHYADADGDGLTDPEELDVHGTSPVLWDTDRGGAGDGDEVAAGTDPLDPNDDDDALVVDDTGSASETGDTTPIAGGGQDTGKSGGCGCGTGSSGGWAMVALAVAAVRLRRRPYRKA